MLAFALTVASTTIENLVERGWAAKPTRIKVVARSSAAPSQTSITNGNVKSLQFVDEKHGWAAGDAGTMIASRDDWYDVAWPN